MSRTVVTVGGGSTHVLVKGGAGRNVTLDKRTSARIANNRPNTQVGSQGSKIDVQAKPTTVWTGSAMGVQGPKGEPGTDVGSHPTISAESDELFTLLKGTPVALVANKLRRASAVPPFNAVVGLVLDADIVPGATGRVQTDGPMEQPQAEWAVATGIPGSLAADAVYYLAPGGSMQPWAPDAEGNVVAPVGRATSSTEFVIDIDTQVHL